MTDESCRTSCRLSAKPDSPSPNTAGLEEQPILAHSQPAFANIVRNPPLTVFTTIRIVTTCTNSAVEMTSLAQSKAHPPPFGLGQNAFVVFACTRA
eukprot:8816561-Pyramimonas_sp.AAC.1